MLVSDVEMPGLDGVSLAAALCRVAPGGAGVPALLVSGHPLRPAAGPELAGVRFAFVPKPFTLAQLDAALTPLEAEIG
jgi:CheY-like chemotaxis protein